MASPSSDRHRRREAAHFSHFLNAASTNLSAFITPKPPSSRIHLPLLLPSSPLSLSNTFDSSDSQSISSKNPSPQSSTSTVKNMRSSEPSSGFPSTVRISTGKGGGPAFVGQVYSMCDLSGTGLMAVSTQFEIPFLSKRTPQWLKKMFAAVTKSERKGPVFRFFMDLGDAVSYVKHLNIPSGVVGACRLDIAYEHFKEKPDMFQFVPNDRQVKEANKLLKTLPNDYGNKKVEGVPVFGAQNLDIAIATTEGIKWYTPYFFDKNMLDNILEDSADQHFDSLIQTRHIQRRRDVVDDSLGAEMAEEMGENMWEPPEVQEVMDEVGHPGIPLSVISKVAEIQFLYAVDRVILGNRWLRKATGIQPKFPYMVDSFEKKSAASLLRAKTPPTLISNSEFNKDTEIQNPIISEIEGEDSPLDKQEKMTNFKFPFGDWFSHPWLKQKHQKSEDTRGATSKVQHKKQEVQSSPFLPKITMVGISTGEPGKMSKSNIKKTMEDLTKELDRVEQSGSNDRDSMLDERDPLFVANVGDSYPGASRSKSARLVHGG